MAGTQITSQKATNSLVNKLLSKDYTDLLLFLHFPKRLESTMRIGTKWSLKILR